MVAVRAFVLVSRAGVCVDKGSWCGGCPWSLVVLTLLLRRPAGSRAYTDSMFADDGFGDAAIEALDAAAAGGGTVHRPAAGYDSNSDDSDRGTRSERRRRGAKSLSSSSSES